MLFQTLYGLYTYFYHFSSKVVIVISTLSQEASLFNFRLKVAFVSDQRLCNYNIFKMLSYEVRNLYKGNIAFNAIAREDYAN